MGALSPRAIAVQGVGSAPRVLALQGLWPDVRQLPVGGRRRVSIPAGLALINDEDDMLLAVLAQAVRMGWINRGGRP
jgi:hypothetical protein